MSTHGVPSDTAVPEASFRTKRPVEGLDPTHLGSLDVRGVNAHVEDVDGDLVMFVDDGDVEIEFSSGIGGTWEQAIAGAERVAMVAQQYAAGLRARRPVPPAAPE